LGSLLDKRLLFVTGKGGVGKTTVAASLGRIAAERGRRVLLVEVDTQPSIGRLFGDRPIAFEPSQMDRNLWACNLTGSESMRAFVHRFVSSRRVADLILGNRVANIFFESAPSVLEAVILDQLGTLLESANPRYDLVVVDLPASGHAVTLLNVPRAMSSRVRVGELAQRMRSLADLISDPKLAELVLVSLPEEMSVNETIELWNRAAERVETRVRSIVLNGERDPDLHPTDLDDLQTLRAWAGDDTEAFDRVAYGASIGAWWKQRDRENIERLGASVSAHLFRLPFIYQKVGERDLVEKVANSLNAQLAGEP
jgi:anion-transporting  ArsA/GET3 family ATPase